MGVVATWIKTALKIPEENIEAQIISFKFVWEFTFFLPKVVKQNEQAKLHKFSSANAIHALCAVGALRNIVYGDNYLWKANELYQPPKHLKMTILVLWFA